MMRLVAALAVIVGSFIAVCNLAVFWHGALFVAVMLPWGVVAGRVFDWGRDGLLSRQ